MSDIDPNKLKVVDLRSELNTRGLETKGNKAVLVKRLQDALNREKGIAVTDSGDEVEGGDMDTSQDDAMDSSAALDDTVIENPASEEKPEEVAEVAEKAEPVTSEKKADAVTPEKVDPAAAKAATPIKEAKLEIKKLSPIPKKAAALPVNSDLNEQEAKVDSATDEKEANSADNEEAIASVDAGAPVEKDEGAGDETAAAADGDESGQAEKEGEEANDATGTKRKRTSDSPETKKKIRGGRNRRSRSRSPFKVVEDEDDTFDDSLVTLDTYHSDLNLVVDKTRYSAAPLTNDGFAFMWAGARATYGFSEGKIVYEIKVTKNLELKGLPEDEVNPHVARVGWSVKTSTLQLGEDPKSYGFGGTGKTSTNCKFDDYGKVFKEGDVVTSFLNLTVDPVELSYAVNGEHLGVAYSVSKEELGDEPLFPHILTKNCSYDVNFGQLEEPLFKLPEGFEDYTFAHAVEADKKIRAPKGPVTRAECEMIMMCGLPGAGKTFWATQYCLDNPEKFYNILGTNNIIDKMKVMGLPRKRNYEGRWDVLIEKSTKCLNRLLELGARRRRNYVLDQTNVYASAQRRKMRPFEGFKRRAVVIVPTDEEFKSRIAKREKDEGKDVPENAVLEMKVNFVPPEVGTVFTEVEWVEQTEEEAKTLIEKYRKEAKEILPAQSRKFKNNRRGGQGRGGTGGPSRFGGPAPGNRMWDNRNGFRGRGDSFGRPMSGFGGPPRGGPMRRPPMRGGYDHGPPRGGGFQRGGGGGGGYQGGYGGGGYQGGGGGGGYGGGYGGNSFGGGRGGSRGGYDSSRGGGSGGFDGGRGGRGGQRGGAGKMGGYGGASGGGGGAGAGGGFRRDVSRGGGGFGGGGGGGGGSGGGGNNNGNNGGGMNKRPIMKTGGVKPSYGQNQGYQSYSSQQQSYGQSSYGSSTGGSSQPSPWKSNSSSGGGGGTSYQGGGVVSSYQSGYGQGYGNTQAAAATPAASGYTQQTGGGTQSTLGQQYYNQQWDQWSQQNQNYFNQYYNQYYQPGQYTQTPK